MSTRGIRNNNPANIIRGSLWRGMKVIQTDKKFVQFTSMTWGVRALIYLLRVYVKKHKLYSIRQIISRWAPPEDNNNTEGYIQFCLERIAYVFDADQPLLSPAEFDSVEGAGSWKLYYLCKAMCQIESKYDLTYTTFHDALLRL